eukprot:TRINITY_DN6178_c0_g1_i2.p1 TRINITY_DN6178_c0_g1~~TRINITY_DN6178_c0_g1_i2.p1  ORF type:complete len:700 (+),score=114.02 TRINITY_DN6178_c0_g1_i2:122-2221(+)
MFDSCPDAVCWLHAVHFPVPDGTAMPWLAEPSARERRRRDLLEDVAKSAVQGNWPAECDGSRLTSMNMLANRHSIFLSRSDLSLEVSNERGETQVQIPLLLADIVQEEVSSCGMAAATKASSVIAIGPRKSADECDDDESENAFGEPLLNEVWLLCVGNCDSIGMRRILFDLSSLGAVRWDFEATYTMTTYCLGSGGCGDVYLGQAKNVIKNTNSAKIDALAVPQVAMKILKQSKMPVEDSIRSELSFLATAQGHPNLSILFGTFCQWEERAPASGDSGGSGVFDSQESAQSVEESWQNCWSLRWCIVLNWCTNGDLWDFLDSHGTLSWQHAVETLCGVFSAISHLHSLRIVHRDVKAENILMHDHQPCLADFGICARLDDTLNLQRSVGSPGYAAPEVVIGKPYNEKVDIFSSGVVFYYMLTLKLPFQGKSLNSTLAKTVKCRVPFQQDVFQELPGDILSLFKTLLAKQPQERPAASQALQVLQECMPKQPEDSPAASHAKQVADIEAQPAAEDQVDGTSPSGRHVAAEVAPLAGSDSGNCVAKEHEAMAQHADGTETKSPTGRARLASPSNSATSAASVVVETGGMRAQNEEVPPQLPTLLMSKESLQPAKQEQESPQTSNSPAPVPPDTPKTSAFMRWARYQLARPFSKSQKASASASSAGAEPSCAERTKQTGSIKPQVPSRPQPSCRRPQRAVN